MTGARAQIGRRSVRASRAAVSVTVAALTVAGFAAEPHRALLLMAVPTTFAMPMIASLEGWRTGFTGPQRRANVLNILAVVIVAAGLTVAGEAIVGHVELTALFTAGSRSRLTTFPYLVPLGALTYVTFLQLGVVSEGRVWLPQRLGRLAGPAAIAVCFTAAAGGYLLLTNWDSVAPDLRARIALRPTRGPLPALDLVAWLVSVTGWQAAYNLLGGWPLTRIQSPVPRRIVANASVLGLGSGTYVLARAALSIPAGELEAAIAMFAGSGLIIAELAGGSRLFSGAPGRRRVKMLGGALVLAAAGDAGLRTLVLAWDHSWTTTSPAQVWIVICGLNMISGAVLTTRFLAPAPQSRSSLPARAGGPLLPLPRPVPACAGGTAATGARSPGRTDHVLFSPSSDSALRCEIFSRSSSVSSARAKLAVAASENSNG